MKNFKSRIVVFAVLSIAAMGFMSCKHNNGTMSSITVTPANSSIAVGGTQQFTATAEFTDGTTVAWTNAATWSSDNTAVTISNAADEYGLASALTSIPTGSTITITATDTVNNISGTATLVLTDTPLVSIAITPNYPPSIASGATQQFTATGTYADGSTQIITKFVTWSSANTEVATFSDDTTDYGLATSVAAGTTTITATDSGTKVSASTTLVVQ